jgi:hypothetical protein
MLPQWVIVETKPQAEELAERQFRSAGYRAYFPRYRKLLLPHGVDRPSISVMRPLFARLVFVQDWRGWPKISIGGAVGLMAARPGNAKLADADVALIMERERVGDFDMVGPRGDGRARGDLMPGDKVELEAGFGTRIMGVLDELSPNGKAVIWTVIFDRLVKTSVDAETLHKVVV